MSKKRAERERIIESLIVTELEVWQDKPYTAVSVTAWFPLVEPLATKWGVYMCKPYMALGFAKVNWPDTWDAEYGKELAKKRALVKVAKEIQRGEG